MRSGDDLQPVTLRVPGSKSQTQRALILSALAEGTSLIEQPLECDDSARLRDALQAMGVEIVVDPGAGCWRITGAELRAPDEPLWCGDAGTVARFLSPLSLLTSGELVLDGSARLRQRPMAGLVRALQQLGISARSVQSSGRATNLPLALRRRDACGETTSVDAAHSSQFASALLMVGPCLPHGLELGFASPAVSGPYLEMTVEMMRDFGAAVTPKADGAGFDVAAGRYRARQVSIEGDWSSASFLLAGAWIAGRSIEIENLDGDSLQGDRAICGFLGQLDDDGPHRFDLNQCPDLVAPLAAAAVFAKHPTEITNVAHARFKESDRLAVLARELARAGVCVEERTDGVRIEPTTSQLVAARLDSSSDHRMAMAMALLSLREPGIEVTDHACVNKSYPTFWSDLERLRG